ncbi:MAG TPA: Ig-like domain-containing protein [Bryobacteraceae bacterium]|nr:Ig-like domain-containing protein [Bryobacteraceae bacterium]
MSHGILKKSVVCLAVAACALQAQRLFVAPGANQGGNNIQVLAVSPLSSITGFQAGDGTFLILGLPDGSKYYAISTASSQSVTKIDSSFEVPEDIAAFPQPPTDAVLTPDGSLLAVAAGTLHLFDTTTDLELVPGGINVGTGISVIDIAVSLDGSTLYALGTGAGSTQINAIDVASHLVTGTIGVHGIANSISVGPNGLIYVTLPSEVIDINPNTFTQNSAGPIAIVGSPGRPAFTADGQYALFANQTPSTGTALSLVSLANRAVIATTPSLQIGLDTLLVTGTDTILGYASSTQTAYQITINSGGTLGVSLFPLPNASGSPTAFAISNEVPVNGIPYVSSLYTVQNNVVEQLNPQNGEEKSVSTLPTNTVAGALSFTRPAITNEQPIILLQYGGAATLAPSITSPPFVVRVLDSNGLPISGVPVTFATNGPGASVSPATVTTASNGYAVTYLNTGVTPGPLQVTATAGTKSVVFDVTVSSSSATAPQGLTFVSGQGQILPAGYNTDSGIAGSHLEVKVSDQNGNPLPNTAVTFLITSGTGTLFSTGEGEGGNSQTVTSDADGVAFVDISVPSELAGGDTTRGFGQVQVVASAPGTNSLTFTVTYTPLNSPATIQQQTPQLGTPITGQVDQILPGALTYLVISNTGYPIPGVSVNLSTQGLNPALYPSAHCNDPNGTGVLSDGTGTITCDLVIGPRVGTTSVVANVGYSINLSPFQLTVTAGPPAIVNLIQGNNQSGPPGATLTTPLVVQVTDEGGNILAGTPVVWTVASGSATLTQIISVTDINGHASAVAILGNTAGPVQITATAGSATAIFNLAVVIPFSGIQKVSGDAQSAAISTAFSAPLVVEVTDANGNGVQGATVDFQVTSGSATVGSATAVSGANGQASTTVQAGSTPGPVTITAGSGAFTVTFNLTVRPPGPTNLTIINGASFQAGTGISPGGIAIINGLGILPGVQGLVSANNIVGPLPTTLQGASVTFAGVAAPIYYVMNSNGVEQMAVQVPFETLPAGTTAATNVNVVVTSSGGSSATISVPVKPFAPGIFTTTSGTTVLPVAQRPDGSYVSPTNPAQLGEDITVYVTGLGQVTPAAATGAAGIPGQAVAAPLLIGLNNGGVPLISANYVQGLTGVYAVTFQVPANTATGSAQPLAVVAYDSAGNFYFSQGISIPVQ